MISRQSPTITSSRTLSPSAIVWRALGWLGVIAWLAQIAVNAVSYARGHRWPPTGNLLPRLVALPAALRLPSSFAGQAAWVVAGMALCLTTVLSALTFGPASGRPAAQRDTPAAPPLDATDPLEAPEELTPVQPQTLPATLPATLPDVSATSGETLSARVEALPAPARQLFAALGAFASNDIGRAALLSVGAALGDADAEASLDALLGQPQADITLSADLPVHEEGAESADRERLRLAPLTHIFARDLLDGVCVVADDPPWSPERRALAHHAMTAWYADDVLAAPAEALALDEANIMGALAWAEEACEDRLLARLCAGMARYWSARDRIEVRERYLPLAVAAARREAAATDDRDDHLLAAHLEVAYAELQRQLGALPSARSLLESSLQTCVDQRDQGGESIALCKLGDLALLEGNILGARAAYERALALMWITQDQFGEGVALSRLGDIALMEGNIPTARTAYERALATMRETGDLRNEGAIVPKLGDIAFEEGDTAAARAAYKRYLAIMREVHDEREESVALIRLADVSEDMGELGEAESLYREALAIARRISSPSDLADTLLLAGHFLTQHERGGDEGRRMLAEAATIYMRLGRAGHAEYARGLTDGPAVNAGQSKTAAAHVADHRKRSRRMRRARRARQVAASAMQMSESGRVRARESKPARS